VILAESSVTWTDTAEAALVTEFSVNFDTHEILTVPAVPD